MNTIVKLSSIDGISVLDKYSLESCLLELGKSLGVAADNAFLSINSSKLNKIDYKSLMQEASNINLDISVKEYQYTESLPIIETTTIFVLKDDFCVVAKGIIGDDVLVYNINSQTVRRISSSILLEAWSGRTIKARKSFNKLESTKTKIFSLYEIIIKHKKLIREAMIGVFCIQITTLILPIVFQIILDKVIIYQGYATLNILVVILVTLLIFHLFMHFLTKYLAGHIALTINSDLKINVIKEILNLNANYFERNSVGKILTYVRELDAVIDLMSSPLTFSLFSSLCVMFLFLSAMLYYNTSLTILVVILLVIYFFVAHAINKRLKERFSEQFEDLSNLDAKAVEIIGGASTIKSNSSDHYHQFMYKNLLVKYAGSWMRHHRVLVTGESSTILINHGLAILVVFIGARSVMSNEMTLGGLMAFYLLLTRVTTPLLLLTEFWVRLQKARVALNKVENLRQNETKLVVGSDLKFVEDIRFENVCFGYSDRVGNVLKNISLDISIGDFVAIVGRSGSGKSTFTKLIQNLYTVREGNISINGIDIQRINQDMLRESIGVVDQDILLFNDTIYQNIVSGDDEIPVQKVVEICEKIGAHEFINKLPERYNTRIGDSGISLSGGEKQRIAIARALVKNPPILIMDEPSSAMDYYAESLLIQSLPEICKNRIVILIAHRLSTVRRADKIYVLDDGQIIEKGNHDELIQAGGYYSKAYDLQLG